MDRPVVASSCGSFAALRSSVIERLRACLRDLNALGEELAAIDVNQALLKLGDEGE